MKFLEPEVLILSNRFDFASDYIAAELKKRNVSYVRLNQEEFQNIEISFFPTEPRLIGTFGDVKFEITEDTLKSIFFRRPIFLRDNYKPNLTPSEQLSRSQWAAFNRGMMVFTNCIWINRPQSTYAAESKSFQLYMAALTNFKIPKTLIANTDSFINNYFPSQKIAAKSLDAALLKINGKEAFVYTNCVEPSELSKDNLAISPVVLQEYLSNKIDIRVTVIKNNIFSVCIKSGDKGVDGDWRLMKDKVEYIPVELPSIVKDSCVRLTKDLGLYFGAIDLAISNNEYYFLEINPTGEWAWLVDRAKLPIDLAIVDLLCGELK